MLQMVEMTVFSDYVVGIGCYGAVNEFIVILVDVGKQVEVKVGFAVYRLWMAGDGFHHIMGHSG